MTITEIDHCPQSGSIAKDRQYRPYPRKEPPICIMPYRQLDEGVTDEQAEHERAMDGARFWERRGDGRIWLFDEM